MPEDADLWAYKTLTSPTFFAFSFSRVPRILLCLRCKYFRILIATPGENALLMRPTQDFALISSGLILFLLPNGEPNKHPLW
jgi:hypothetical protein